MLESAEKLRELLSYDPVTGDMIWLPRPRNAFKNDRLFNSWNARFAGNKAFTSSNSDGYLSGSLLGKTVKAHRIAWAIATGDFPDQIDHINGVRSDNRIENLRPVTNQENTKNQATPKSNTSGVMGVSWHRGKGKWAANIKINGKAVYLGTFGNFDDAVSARKSAEIRFGFHENHGRAA